MPATTQSTTTEGTAKNGNGNSNLPWGEEQWAQLKTIVHDEAAKIRIARRLIPLYGNSDGIYVDFVVGHEVDPGPPLSIPHQSLVPVEISVEFELARAQFADEQVAAALATRAAYILALAEDAVVLLGGAGAGAFLKSLNVNVDEKILPQQIGLFEQKPAEVSGSIHESILGGDRTAPKK